MMQVVLITTDNYITQTVAHNNLLKKSAPRPFEEAFGSRFLYLHSFADLFSNESNLTLDENTMHKNVLDVICRFGFHSDL